MVAVSVGRGPTFQRGAEAKFHQGLVGERHVSVEVSCHHNLCSCELPYYVLYHRYRSLRALYNMFFEPRLNVYVQDVDPLLPHLDPRPVEVVPQ